MLKINLQLFAHKKGMGSTKNGRDSESKRLGEMCIRDRSRKKSFKIIKCTQSIMLWMRRRPSKSTPEDGPEAELSQ